MGAGYHGQVLAAVICATIPQGLLQASGAKNDYVLAFWLLTLTGTLGTFVAADVVTADGNLVTASETENTELLWAARGAGPGFFGVATNYRLRLYPLPKAITTSTLIYPLEKLPEVVKCAAETVNTLPGNV
jgi:hypothetical protein